MSTYSIRVSLKLRYSRDYTLETCDVMEQQAFVAHNRLYMVIVSLAPLLLHSM